MVSLFGLIFVFYCHAEARDQIFVGARPLGMAGAFLAIADDGNAISWNPAGLPSVRHQEINSMYSNLYRIDLKDSYLCYVLPITDNQAIGIDWYHSGFDDEELGFTENQIRLSYGYNIIRKLSLGTNVKYLKRDMALDGISVDSFNGFGFDFGILFSPIKDLKVGVMAHDATNTWIKHDETDTKEKVLSNNLRFGVSYKPIKDLTVAMDVDDSVRFGAEYWMYNIFAARCGLVKDFSTGENPSYTAGWSLKYSLLQFDYAYNVAPTLPDTHRFSASLGFEFNPQLVKIETLELNPVFASLYKRYSQHDAGTVVLRNKHKEPLEVSVSVFIPGYMDAPTEVAREVLPPAIGDEPAYAQPMGLKPVLSDKMLSLISNAQRQIEVVVSYEHLKRTRQVKSSAKATLYKIGMLPLGEDVSPIAALIDPDDEAVHQFARGIMSQYASYSPLPRRERMGEGEMSAISENTSKAMLLFDALSAYGIKYVSDPYNPYSEVSGKKEAIDSVKYPKEVLNPKNKTGDCDDCSALYSALLENVGIHTMLVDVPGHVYIMFDTGIHSNSFEQMCLPEDMYIVSGETIWLPVEVTLFGKPFANAWQEGLSEYHKWQEKGELKLVDVHQAWEEYQRTHPPTPTPEITTPTLAEMEGSVLADIQQIQRLQNDFLLALEQGVQTTPSNLAQRNSLGITYVGLNEYDKAEEQFQQIITIAPDNFRLAEFRSAEAAAHNNLANLYVIEGRADAAISSYEKARNLSPDDPGIYLNLGIGYLITDNATESQKILEQAFQKLKGYKDACNLVGVPSQEPSAKGAKEPLMAVEIRTLFINAAKGTDVEAALKQLRPRAQEVGKKETYLYWKR
jgi:tetratricopeptide (TPR) repeat protein